MLLGSTDFTLAVAEAIEQAGEKVGAIAHVGEWFQISYANEGVRNVRNVDIPGWCAANKAKAIQYTGTPGLEAQIEGEHYALCVLAGWYHMVPPSFREQFRFGCIGFHASLLPELRGGAPLSWAILSEMKRTGLSMFKVGDGVDDGDLYGQVPFPIHDRSNVAELIHATEDAMRHLVRSTLPGILYGNTKPRPQVGVPSYCIQRKPEDGRIDWRMPATFIDRLVRATSLPYPGGLTKLEGRAIAIHRTELVTGGPRGDAGQIFAPADNASGPRITCGSGCIEIVEAVFEDANSAISAIAQAAGARLDT